MRPDDILRAKKSSRAIFPISRFLPFWDRFSRILHFSETAGPSRLRPLWLLLAFLFTWGAALLLRNRNPESGGPFGVQNPLCKKASGWAVFRHICRFCIGSGPPPPFVGQQKIQETSKLTSSMREIRRKNRNAVQFGLFATQFCRKMKTSRIVQDHSGINPDHFWIHPDDF